MDGLVFDAVIFGSGRKVYRAVLALFYLLGLGCGMAAYILCRASFTPLLRRCLSVSPDSVGLLLVLCIPFLLSIAADRLRCDGLMAAVCFLKAFSFGLVALGLCGCGGELGPIAFTVICLGHILSMPVLYFWWLRCFGAGDRPGGAACCLFLSLAILIFSLYIRFVCPVLG